MVSVDLSSTNSMTTLGIYTHEFQESQVRTSDVIAEALNFGKYKELANGRSNTYNGTIRQNNWQLDFFRA